MYTVWRYAEAHEVMLMESTPSSANALFSQSSRTLLKPRVSDLKLCYD